MKKPKPYKRIVTRKGETFCPCRHCDKGGWDAYMLQGDLWKMVLPPDVRPSYAAGFVCLRCALESIDRPLCREDITGCSDGYPSLGEDDSDIEIRFPKRDAKRKIHAIHITPWSDLINDDDPVAEIERRYGWLLDRLAIQANTVSVRAEYTDGVHTVGIIKLAEAEAA